ncbi:MAG: serine hydrolase [Chloroflexi bacterium]|nr:serine hydrolase [Ardenticatenaceae bacterium]MBL1128142.1 serine hydrolase [Chloroflexota bacterium]NOG34214.1 serine hydrolase [Chloroflexota bacterium]GIK55344.1 MAG: serine hydrolase [Chloroflexota bacterium]
MEWLAELCAGFDGRVGVSALNLQTNEQFLYHAEEMFPTASAIKLAVLAALMQQVEVGQYTLDAPLMLRRADQISGSGILQFLTPGLVMPLRDWAFLMMNMSDNLATNVLIDHVGLAYIQEWLAAHDYPDVQIHRKIDFGILAQDITQLGTATPSGLNRLMTAVFRQEILSPAACNEMLRMMDRVGSERVGRYLPFAFYGDETPEEEKLRLAGKTGSLKGCRVQTAVVWRGTGANRRGFSITVMADGDPAPELWSADAAGVLLIGRIARAVYDQVFMANRP